MPGFGQGGQYSTTARGCKGPSEGGRALAVYLLALKNRGGDGTLLIALQMMGNDGEWVTSKPASYGRFLAEHFYRSFLGGRVGKLRSQVLTLP